MLHPSNRKSFRLLGNKNQLALLGNTIVTLLGKQIFTLPEYKIGTVFGKKHVLVNSGVWTQLFSTLEMRTGGDFVRRF